jgi:amidase
VKHQEYVAHDALALAELVRLGEVTPLDLVEAAISRMDAVNDQLNAVVHRMDDTARATAVGELPDGPFRGVPFLVKDMDGFLAGEPCTFSSRSLRDYVPNHDSELFARFRRAGVIVAGKTNCPEFGILGVTEPEFRGPARNPWNLDHTPGGSSGGSAAAVAAGIVPVAHAGDGGGSIRIPASACGLFGMKPSRARTPLGPTEGQPLHGLVVRHVVSRTVRDSAAFLDVTQGGDVGAPYASPPDGDFHSAVGRNPEPLRIGFSTQSMLGRSTDPECVAAVDEAVAILADLGHEVIEVDLPIDREGLTQAYLTIVAASVSRQVVETEEMTGRKPDPDDFEAVTWFLRQVGDVLSARDLDEALELIARTTRRLGALFADQIDVHVSATMPYPPVRVGELAPTSVERAALRALRTLPINVGPVLRGVLAQLASNSLERLANTKVWNMTGQPAMSVPLHWTATGLPVGVQFAGAFGAEEQLFSLAGQIERVQPWLPRLTTPTTRVPAMPRV